MLGSATSPPGTVTSCGAAVPLPQDTTTPSPHFVPTGYFCTSVLLLGEAQRIKVLWAQLIALWRSFVFLYKANPGGKRIFFALPGYQRRPKKLQPSHVPTRISLTLLLCERSVFMRNCHLTFQTRFPCFTPSFFFFLIAARKQSTALSHFADSLVTEGAGVSPPVFKKEHAIGSCLWPRRGCAQQSS